MRVAAIAFFLLAALHCRSAARQSGPISDAGGPGDTVEARRLFEENIASIHQRDRARYVATYLHSEQLTRNGPGGIDQGFERWPARTDTTWPDTLVARDLRLVPVAPGVVYGTYHYRVTQRGATSEGVSERVFVRTPVGWRIAVSTAFGLPSGAAPPPVALVGGTLLNPRAPAIANAAIVVRDGRIVCAGALGKQCTPPAGIEVIDVTGTFITPGLIDAHVHYSQTGWVDGRPDALDVRDEYPYDSVVAALRDHPERLDRAYLCSGVTSVYDVGGYPWTFDLARRSHDRLDEPHIAAAGPLLSTIDHWVNLPTMRQFVHMRDDSIVRATVRAQARLGASAIKVWYLQLPDSLRPRAKTLLVVAGDEARKVGLPLIVHATQLPMAKDALEAGAKVLVHSVETADIDEELIAGLRRNGAIVIPTLTVREGYADVYLGRSPAARYPLDCVDAATRAKLTRVLPETKVARRREFVRGGTWDAQRATMERNLRRLVDAGIPIAMGTDAGNPGTAHGPSVYREMEALQQTGMPAREVLASATIVAAQAMGIEREAGSLERGKRADLAIFDADPWADIANARRVRMVMRNGALYGRAELLPKE